MTDEDFKYMDELRKTIHRQEADIDRLKNECFCIANERDAYKDVLDTAVTEAIKEFTERLKDHLRQKPKWNIVRDNYKNVGFSYDDVFFGIDNIVKEMVGDDNA